MTVPKHYALLEHKAVPTERRVNATSMQRNSSDLTTLPPGVLLHLIQCLAVYDILCLRRTCKRLSKFTHHRAIWHAALMNQCLEHDIPLMTYSFADMSAQQLELAVLRPFKFEKRMQEADHPHYPVARVFTLCLPGDEVPIDKDRHVLNSLFVVPGGRYILSSSNSGWIRCWDLGSEGIGSRPPSIMASYFVSKSAYIAVQRSHESSSVFTLLVIEAEGRITKASNLQVLKFNLAEPCFVHVWGTEVVHKQPLNFIELEGSFVYFMDVTGDILIWNWEEDTFGVLDVGEQFGTESDCKCYQSTILGSSLLLFQQFADRITMLSMALPRLLLRKSSALYDILPTERFSVPLTDGYDEVHYHKSWRPHSLPSKRLHPPCFILTSDTESAYKLYHLLPYTPSPNIAEGVIFPKFTQVLPTIKQDNHRDPIYFSEGVSRRIAFWITSPLELRAQVFQSGFRTPDDIRSTPASVRLGSLSARVVRPRVLQPQLVRPIIASPWTGSVFIAPPTCEVRMLEFA